MEEIASRTRLSIMPWLKHFNTCALKRRKKSGCRNNWPLWAKSFSKQLASLPDGRVSKNLIQLNSEMFSDVNLIFILLQNSRYGLTPHEIENQLPLLDTHKTNLLKYCPDFMSPLHCTPGKYRRFDGLCNNLQNPTWGARLTSFTR